MHGVHSLTARVHVGKNKCSAATLVVSVENQDTCAITSVIYYHYHHSHLRMFLFPVVCHSPQVLGSPPQTGSCNPPQEPLCLEVGGSYLRTKQTKFKVAAKNPFKFKSCPYSWRWSHIFPPGTTCSKHLSYHYHTESLSLVLKCSQHPNSEMMTGHGEWFPKQ